MEWIIDRFEGNIVVIECNGKCFNVDKSMLPSSIKEGDILDITINLKKTNKQRAKVEELMNDLFID